MSLLKACLIIFFLSQCCLSLNDSHRRKLITSDIDEFIKSVIQQWNLTGLAIAVVRQNPGSPEGWLQEFGSYGRAKADGTPVTPDTLFSLASNSKLFTALSTGLLISNETLKEEKGIDLSWSSKAKDVFGRTWGLMDQEASRGTSLQDMLSHRTGLPRHDGSNIPRKGGLVDKACFFLFLPDLLLTVVEGYNVTISPLIR
jgi:CubicO group peptidase (beta-lactamase class C family)